MDTTTLMLIIVVLGILIFAYITMPNTSRKYPALTEDFYF